MSSLYEFTKLRCLCLRIRVAPMSPMIRVVLRAIDIDVQLMLAIKLELSKPVLMAPWIAVEALYDTSASDTRPVTNLETIIKEIDLLVF